MILHFSVSFYVSFGEAGSILSNIAEFLLTIHQNFIYNYV